MAAAKKKLRLTSQSLVKHRTPGNNCAVKQLLDTLDPESRTVLEEALALPAKELSANSLRAWLIAQGANEDDLPSTTRISDHRRRRAACRCGR